MIGWLLALLFIPISLWVSYFYVYKLHLDDVPQPDDDCPFWTGDAP